MTRNTLPNRRPCVTVKVIWQTAATAQTFHVSAGFDPATGELAEVFAADGQRSGSDLQAVITDACVLTSLLLQHGVSLGAIGRSLGREPHMGGTRPASVIGAIVEALAALAEVAP